MPVSGNRPTAIDLATLSKWIYENEKPFRKLVNAKGWTTRLYKDHKGTQVALVEAKGWTALVFRGTQVTSGSWWEKIRDFSFNLRAFPTGWAGSGWAHAGYDTALSRVRYDARRMAEEVSSTIPLYVTGHSLGGVLAHLYAAWIKADEALEYNLAGLVTFGAPKGGTKQAFAPLTKAQEGTHAPTQMEIDRYIIRWDLAPWWPFLILSHPPGITRLEPPQGCWRWPLQHHDIDTYINALSTASQTTTPPVPPADPQTAGA